MATVVVSTGLAVVSGAAAGNTQTFAGKVSDAMCGAKHSEWRYYFGEVGDCR